MARKEKNWNSLAEELSEMLEGGYEGTAVEVVIGTDNASIEVIPKSSTTGAFHKVEDIVDFCRCKRLSCYCYTEFRDGKTVCCARIF